MKLSDYVIQFLVEKGVKDVFMLPGGGCMHLVDSLGKNKAIDYTACLHEQAASIAAESYAQHTNKLGAVLVTTGPGGTNAITGLTAAWIDSTPVMFISGQVKRSDRIGKSGVRQMGSQEVEIVPIVQSLTKFAQTIDNPDEIRYALEKAYYLAMHGRRGPVWIDIPLDVQAAEIEPEQLRSFVPTANHDAAVSQEQLRTIVELLENAQRPLILAGNGIKLSEAIPDFEILMQKLQVPVLLTWKTIDMLDFDNPLYFGCPGGMGHRYGNFILQNADLLLILGSRLDSSLTAFNHKNFAPHAKKIMIDIDAAEIKKMQMKIAVPVVADMQQALKALNEQSIQLDQPKLATWLGYCKKMKDKYPVVTADMYEQKDFINAHVFTKELFEQLKSDDVIVPESSGGAGEMTYQAMQVKKGQKIKNAAGLGSMGFGLPYAIGACIANGKRRTVLINGDGAFQLNIQELATLAQSKLPIKIFIWCNGGYASIRTTQRSYFDGNYVASNAASKLCIPDIGKVAAAYGLQTCQIHLGDVLSEKIKAVLSTAGPVLCEVFVDPLEIACPRSLSQKLPNGNMVSKPLEDMWPYLPAEEVKENMLP